MPIRVLVAATAQPSIHARRRFDPVLVVVLMIAVGIAAWSMAPLASGAIAPVTSDTRIEVEVPIATAVTPGWQTGEADVRIPNLSMPGEPRDVSSDGWKMSTNWVNGYEVRIRATTDPALRGLNAVDGGGAKSSFEDFKTSADCPCPWTGNGYTRGVFGYSIKVTSNSGTAALDTAKWGTPTARKWRGFAPSSYRAYSTAGGTGQYTMSVLLRSMIPEGATQLEGSYRAGIVVSAHPLM